MAGVLHIDRQSPSDRRTIQPFIDVLVAQHGPGGLLEPPQEVIANLQPPPLGRAAAKPAAPKAAAPAPKAKAAASAAAAGDARAPKAGGFGGFGASAKKGAGGKKRRKKR